MYIIFLCTYQTFSQILFQNFYLYITQILLFQNFLSVHNTDTSFSKLSPVHNTDTLSFEKYFFTDKTSIIRFCFICTFTLNTIGIERSIIPCETAFKSMGLSYSVSPNPPMYIHLCLYINTRSCTYSFPCTQSKLVNNQVTLVSKRSLHRHLFIFHKLLQINFT